MRKEYVFLIGLIIILAMIIPLIFLTTSGSIYPTKWGFFSISTNSSNETPYFVGITCNENSNEATYVISEYEYSKNQSDFYVTLPEMPYNIKYLTLNESEIDRHDFKYMEKIYEPLFLEKENYPYNYLYFKDGESDQFSLAVRPKEIENYYGVEFTMKNQLFDTRISEKQFVLPISVLELPDETYPKDIQKYRIQILSPNNYDLIESVPQPNRFVLRGHNQALYQFNIDDPKKGTLSISFQNKTMNSQITFLLIILSTILGIGLTLAIESLFIKNKTEN